MEIVEVVITGNNKIQYFGLPVSKIKEIIKTPEIVSIPKTEEYLDGVIDLRGNVISMFNFPKWLNVYNGEKLKKTLIVEFYNEIYHKQDFLGFMVGDVTRIHRIPEKNLKKTYFLNDEKIAKKGKTYLSCIAQIEQKLVGIIDFDLILKKIIKQKEDEI